MFSSLCYYQDGAFSTDRLRHSVTKLLCDLLDSSVKRLPEVLAKEVIYIYTYIQFGFDFEFHYKTDSPFVV